VTGFLVRSRDLISLKNSLQRLAADPALRRRMGEAGREFVRERFSAEQMVNELHRLYLRLAQQ